jgi:hypothetical protein
MIKHYIDLYLEGDRTLQGRKQIMVDHKHKIEQSMQEFSQYLEIINNKIDHYSLLINGEHSSASYSPNSHIEPCTPERST